MRTRALILMTLIPLSNSYAAQIGLTPNMSSALASPLRGVNVNTEKFVGDCLSGGEVQADGQNVGQLSLDFSTTSSSNTEKMGFNLSAQAKIGLVNYSASANYAKETTANDFTMVYSNLTEASFEEVYKSTSKNPIVLNSNFSDAISDPLKFYQSCGSEYVEKTVKTARLFVTLKINFTSREEKKKFDAKFGAEAKVFKVNGGLSTESKYFNQKNSLAIKVIQLGGDPGKIGKVICPKNANGKVDSECDQNSGAVVQCSFANLSSCMTVLENLTKYANSQAADNFPNQILDHKNYNSTSVITRPYIFLSDKFPIPQREDAEINQAQLESLSKTFDRFYNNMAYADDLIYSKHITLSENQKSELANTSSIIRQEILPKLSITIQKCYEGPTVCENSINGTLNPKLAEYKDKKLDKKETIEKIIEPEMFIQYCERKEDFGTKIVNSVEGLKRYLLTKELLTEKQLNDSGNDSCALMAGQLDALKSINLNEDIVTGFDESKKAIHAKLSSLVQDLNPVFVLKNLTTLNLSGLNLQDLNGIERTGKLEDLDISNNQLTDISNLQGLSNLKTIKAANNKIENASTLQNIKNLRSLDVTGNDLGEECPVKNLKWCKVIDYKNLFSETAVGNSPGSATYARDCFIKMEEMFKDHVSYFGGAAYLSTKEDNGDNIIFATGGTKTSKTDLSNNFTPIDTISFIKGFSCTSTPVKLLKARTNHQMAMSSDGKKIYLIGGSELAIERITSSSEVPQKLIGSLPGLAQDSLKLKNGSILLGINSDVDKRFYVFNPNTEELKLIATSRFARSFASLLELSSGEILISGGLSGGNAIGARETYSDMLELLNLEKATVKILPFKLKKPRASFLSFQDENGKVYFLGGRYVKESTPEDVTSVEVLDFNLKKIETMSNENVSLGREFNSGVVAKGNINLIFGQNGTYVLDSKLNSIYNISSNDLYMSGRQPGGNLISIAVTKIDDDNYLVERNGQLSKISFNF